MLSSHTVLVFMVVLLSTTVRTQDTEECYTTKKANELYRLYGGRTAYETVRGQEVLNETYPGCKAKFIYVLVRDGITFPETYERRSLERLLPPIMNAIINNNTKKVKLCDSDIEYMQNWTMKFKDGDSFHVSFTGGLELYFLAQRLKKRYPTLMDTPYNDDEFRIRHTDSQLSRESAVKFIMGLHNNTGISKERFQYLMDHTYMKVLPERKDKLLKFYKLCPKYIKEVLEKTIEQEEEFKISSYFNKTMKNIESRIGFRSIPFDHIMKFYDQCRYDDTVQMFVPSPWCALFNQTDFKVLEYLSDLRTYYKEGYGNDINYQMACPLVNDITTFLRYVTENRTNAKAVFRFGHQTTLLSLYTAMGLFYDNKPITSENYIDMKNREWKSSKIAGYTGNIAIVVFHCDGQYKFKMMVNEEDVVFPGCDDWLCPVDKWLESLQDFGTDCNFAEICKYIDPNSGVKELNTHYTKISILILVGMLIFK